MTPLALGLIMGAGSSGKAVERIGIAPVVTAGLSGLAIVLTTTLLWTPDTSLGALLPWVFFLALSMGWVMAPATEAVVSSVPAAKSGVASAMNTVARMVSGALGVAVVGSLVNSLYEDALEPAVNGLPAPAGDAAAESIGAANAVAAQLPPEAGSPLVASAADAFVDAMAQGLLVAAALSAVAAMIVMRVLSGRSVGAHARVTSSSPA
jgi:hypothetical protein